MDDVERWLQIVVPEAAGVYGRHMSLSLQTLRGYVVARRAVLYGGVILSLVASVGLKLDTKYLFGSECECVLGSYNLRRGDWARDCRILCEKKADEKTMEKVGLKIEDVVLSPAAIVLAALEELEKAEEGDGEGCVEIRRRKKKKKNTEEEEEKKKKKKKISTNFWWFDSHMNSQKNMLMILLLANAHVDLKLMQSIAAADETAVEMKKLSKKKNRN
ncbi:uncharacterized protein MONOS_7943 [Monocercomonoides exilis]|uniref:uncharacterized protein n=1 Tax=Monocercomonoides exilis TaxID=2049356 RepID=UPI00355A9BBF|nr:hypothetical protein MONOS_7943 [Monocercomonoides exilis]|eukprot:MONOS_7943.1-p1 / transcript=MONOS_7943.1 / gene=MONOS_7943 / organism=Monocercomonoides_exilis_PA203 / gene_product=unspecified product / transcript_product=unspecified product / location=Mono_scaffold00286:46245-47035(-) / protein_length=217 / sequence_SO=supercontig / SO=protein_coding / is_pseudo=false